ncbi:MAG: hypothetical protein LBO74_01325 [Candidatus Symbiothrix sp.]|nr:hypothetical protein [Candidatus Symbiothrix sp.]
MKKNLFLVLTFIVLSAASVNAQVTIGSEYDPTPGSILDLQSNGSLGLLLPRVTLTDATVWAPVEGDAVDGMTVFHNTDAMTNGLTGKGIYVWANGSWSRMGTPATPCVDMVVSTPKATFTGEIGNGQLLESVVNTGSAPFNYNWYKDGVLLQTNSNKSERRDSYKATDYGTYTCDITNACATELKTITYTVAKVNPGEYIDNPTGITWSLNGITCFDVSEGKDFPASSVYTLAITGATATNVYWVIDDADEVLSAAEVGSTSQVTLPFKSRSEVSTLATDPVSVSVTALITLSTGAKVFVTKTIKLQNTVCCSGYVVHAGVWNGPSSTSMDGYKTHQMGAIGKYFTQSSTDLCVALADEGTNEYAYQAAINVCASKSTDGTNWRLPNVAELTQLETPSYTNYDMRKWVYYSITKYDATHVWYIDNRNTSGAYPWLDNGTRYVRCVHDM